MEDFDSCRCENAFCQEEHMENGGKGCKKAGSLECMFIGFVCEPCSVYIPQWILDYHENERLESLFVIARNFAIARSENNG